MKGNILSDSPTSRNVAALLLAAGLSKRARPHNKLLEPAPGDPAARMIVRASAETLLASQAHPIIVVTGHQSKEIGDALANLDTTFVHNPNFSSGMAGSLAVGIKAVPETAAGAIVALGDMPNLSPNTLDALITAFAETNGHSICIPNQDGRRGNPVLFGRKYFGKLTDLSGDHGGKVIVEANSDAVLEVVVSDPGIHVDFDTL